MFCCSNLFTFDNGFLFIRFTVSMVGTFNAWTPMCHSIVDKIDLKEHMSKLNLVEFGKGMQGAFNLLKCLCSLNIVGKWGTPFLWCKSIWCVYKCYFQIWFPLSNFSSCLCSTILCFLHFNHLGSQILMFVFMS